MHDRPSGPEGCPPASPGAPKRVVIVDDSETFCRRWREFLECRYRGRVRVEAWLDPVAALRAMGPDVDLLLLDLEMPVIDGRKFLEFAVARGVDRRRAVVVSARDAEGLHELFPMGACLAVINKEDPPQQAAFLMILDSLLGAARGMDGPARVP